MTDESIRLFLAQDLHEVERDVQEHEELELTARWAPLDAVVAAALDGTLENAACLVGVLAVAAARTTGFSGLRPADAPWRARPDH